MTSENWLENAIDTLSKEPYDTKEDSDHLERLGDEQVVVGSTRVSFKSEESVKVAAPVRRLKDIQVAQPVIFVDCKHAYVRDRASG